jgi:hypothetical protein
VRTPGALPSRDFGGNGVTGTSDPANAGGSMLAVLLTAGDDHRDWLRASRALQHVLLRAASDWVFASFATQPLELPELRTAVRQACQLPGFPQMMFRLGHSGVTPQTPRRPVAAVLALA